MDLDVSPIAEGLVSEHAMPSASGQDQLIDQRMAGFGFDDPDVPREELPLLIEALLLAAPAAVSLHELSGASGWPLAAVREALDELESAGERGWVVQRHGQSVQLATNPRFAEQVRRLLGFEREARLSAAALETLAIVAYQQPVTRAAIEAVRGVDSSGVLTTLMSRGLVEPRQRTDLPGQPFEYRTTSAFLQHFGIRSLSDLPDLSGPDGSDLGQALASAVDEAERAEPELELAGTMIQEASAGELANA
ncbi:MAG: SMC-Scp complex subunit ScpB [Thermomicrobiales bacterium]|nr:SMC-Scp complex subunit ScpB [Thermomicrobiales bacterium]